MNASPSTPPSAATPVPPAANNVVPTADLLDYSNWSATVRQQMLKALERRQSVKG